MNKKEQIVLLPIKSIIIASFIPRAPPWNLEICGT